MSNVLAPAEPVYSMPAVTRVRWSFVLFLLVVAATTFLFWPAAWSPDTISQVEQARSGRFTSHHPPLMALILRPFAVLHLEKIMIALQALAYWSMLWLLLGAARGVGKEHVVRATYPMLLPSSIALIGIMWKDVHLALAWGMAWTLLWIAARRQERQRWLLWVVLGLILYGLFLRHNGFLAVAPLLLLLTAGRPWLKHRSTTILAYAGITIAAFLLSQTVNRSLVVANDVPTAQMSLPIFDLAGISHFSGRNAFPFAMSEQQLGQVQRCYQPVRWDSLYFQNSPCHWLMDSMLRYDAGEGSVTVAWLRTIAAEPSAYLQHRVAFVRCLLTYEHQPHEITHQAVFLFAPFGDDVPGRGVLIFSYLSMMNLWEMLGLLTPFVALGWAVGLLWLTRRNSCYPALAAAALTAILNTASHFPFGVASDQRYSYPSFLLLALATSAAILRRRGTAGCEPSAGREHELANVKPAGSA
jgi:hypothetical protein